MEVVPAVARRNEVRVRGQGLVVRGRRAVGSCGVISRWRRKFAAAPVHRYRRVKSLQPGPSPRYASGRPSDLSNEIG
jgi:hypothetical protein